MAGEYIVSARKYRPDSFRSIIGQGAMASTLQAAVLSGKLAHAYLFCGPRGVGKTTAARVLAKTINCLHLTPEGEACNECESCRAFNEQRSLNVFELDAASNNSVEDIRSLTEQVAISPVLGKYKVYIIDEVHMLSAAAFNAFLKTLEEPPSYAIFILATTEKHKILPTILSRCQIYDFKRITVRDIADHLVYVAQTEGIGAEPEALRLIAEKADGGMRDALSMFDRVASFAQGNITYELALECLNVLDYTHYMRLMESVLVGDYRELMLQLNQLIARGFDGQIIINGLSSFLRDLLMVQHPGTLPLVDKPEAVLNAYQSLADRCPTPELYQAIKLLVQCDQQYRPATNKRLLVELTLLNVLSVFSAVLGATNPPAGSAPSGGNSSGQSPKASQTSAPQQTAPQPASSSASQPTPSATAERVAPTPTPRATPRVSPPAPMPKTEVREPVRQPRSTSSGLAGLLNQAQRGANKATASTEQVQVEEELAYTEEQLLRAWVQYRREVLGQEQMILGSMMEQSLPTILPTGEIEVALVSTINLKAFDEIRPHVERYLQQTLRNKHVRLQLRVQTPDEIRFVPTTPEDRYKALVEINPVVAELKDTLNLRIS